MKVKVLGVKIDDISIDQAVQMVEDWLKGPDKQAGFYIVTPNPEMVVLAQKDLEFKKILNNADLAIPDGIGLRLSGRVKHKVAGVDLMGKLVEEASKKAFTVGFLGGRDQVAEKTAECLKEKYPGLKITFAKSGGKVYDQSQWLGLSGRKKPFAIPPTDILFVAFGAPKQEKWIAKSLHYLPIKVAMGVGGSFDYLSGIVPRAPSLIKKIGLEWVFRLLTQPWRIRRQLALLKYLWLLTKQD